tara:strand:+ start:4612 stop:6555 length:1944 start_codon:yes stop_codon:yes gene_type:complete
MCGIAGYFEKKNISKTQNNNIAKNIITELDHRGPDHEGMLFLENHGVTFLHRRLAIIDLSADANQPMTSNSNRYIITYNGEIYNYLQLKEELIQHGHNFQTSSDTEILLTSIDHWGLDIALNKFVGMFAFAIYDKKLKELILVRDRFGEKPIYYSNLNDNLIFGSELKALKAHPAWVGKIDKDSLNMYLKYSYVPSPKSIYKDVYKVNPGSYIKFKTNNNQCKEILKKKWYNTQSTIEPFKGTYSEALELTEILINKSINYQKISDVPVGVFLSGGIDSTLITTLMQKNDTAKVKTFTLGYNNQAYDESIFSKKISNHLGTDHTDWILSENEVIDYIPNMPKIYDEPFADSSQVPTYLVSKLAKQKVKVILTGDGGDELFGGYNRYIYAPNIIEYQKYPTIFKKLFKYIILSFTPGQLNNISNKINKFLPLRYRFSTLTEKLYKLAELIELNDQYEIYDSLISTWKKETPSLLKKDNNKNQLADNFYKIGSSFQERMMLTDLNNYLIDDILVKVDRAAMSNSLETRVPFLNQELVNFALSLPLSMKIDNKGKSKILLRNILYKYVPQKMIDRAKAGFGIPIDSWLRGPLKEWASDLINEKKITDQNYLNFEIISREWHQYLSGKKINHHKLWNILMFQSWLESEKIE